MIQAAGKYFQADIFQLLVHQYHHQNYTFFKMISNMEEVVDYAGVLYRQITIDRERLERNPGENLRVLSWVDAER